MHLWARVTTSQELKSQLQYALSVISIEKLSINIIPIFLNAKENAFHQDGNHWAVLMLVSLPQQSKEPRRLAIYQNPLGLKIPDAVNLLLQGWELFDLQLKQQTNDNDCGPWVVYSVVSLVEKLQEGANPTFPDLQECIPPVTAEQGDQLRKFYQKFLEVKPGQPKLANNVGNISLLLPAPTDQGDKGKEEMDPQDDYTQIT